MNECVNFGACRVVSLRDTPRNAQQAGYNCHQYAKKNILIKTKTNIFILWSFVTMCLNVHHVQIQQTYPLLSKKKIYIKTTQQQLQHLKQHNSLTDQKLVKEWKTTFFIINTQKRRTVKIFWKNIKFFDCLGWLFVVNFWWFSEIFSISEILVSKTNTVHMLL